jgi:hypothetical protein
MQRANTRFSRSSRFGFDLIFGKLLLIFQMPKTGSQTVEASLRQCSLPHRVIRCHFLSSVRAAELRRTIRNNRDGSTTWKQEARRQISLTAKLSTAIRLRNLLRSCGINIPQLEIVTAVRDPISVCLSSIFQNYLWFVPKPEGLTIELCREVLLRPRMFTSLEDWFDLELRPFAGLDVYDRPFPQDQGYEIYENSQTRILLYRFEALHRLSAMVRDFLGCELPATVNRNLGAHKPYAKQYEHVKENLRLPEQFVRARCSTKLARHFYSPAELAQVALTWTRSDPTPAAMLTLLPKSARTASSACHIG